MENESETAMRATPRREDSGLAEEQKKRLDSSAVARNCNGPALISRPPRRPSVKERDRHEQTAAAPATTPASSNQPSIHPSNGCATDRLSFGLRPSVRM